MRNKPVIVTPKKFALTQEHVMVGLLAIGALLLVGSLVSSLLVGNNNDGNGGEPANDPDEPPRGANGRYTRHINPLNEKPAEKPAEKPEEKPEAKSAAEAKA